MSVAAKREYVRAMRKRYRAAAGRKEKSALLDELVEVVGFDRKHAITVMNQRVSKRSRPARKRSGRPRAYRHCLSVVEVVWEALDFCCAERLHPRLVPLAEALARHGELQLTLEAREELARISRATLARRLAELPRAKPRMLRAAPHPARLLQSQVPVDRYRWNETRAGALEVDLVEHSGGLGGGHHAYTLSVVDVVSGWSRRRAVMGKSQAVVHQALQELLAAWPSAVWALHSDNVLPAVVKSVSVQWRPVDARWGERREVVCGAAARVRRAPVGFHVEGGPADHSGHTLGACLPA